MGAFDRYRRATAKKNYRCKVTLLHRKAHAKHLGPVREMLPRSLEIKELEFGSGVHMMIKMETENLLLQKNPCTAYELAVALETSDDLERSITVDTSLDELTSCGKTGHPWKDLVSILQRLQMQTKSQSREFTNWAEAEEWLASAGVLLRTETAAEKEQKSLETFQRHMTKTTEALARRFRMKNFKIRMFSQRFKEIANYRAAGDELKELERVEEEAYQEAIQVVDDFRVPEAAKEAEERMLAQEREEEANRIASSLLRPLTEKEQAIVDEAIYGVGPASQIVAQVDTDVVVRESMHRLRPGQWLNDEIIHYFLIMLAKRDEALSKKDPSRKRSHFFKSFFITKLLNEGHANADIEGTYDYRNIKRWSKKVPGKDIFDLDKIIFPINQGNAHWICVVAFMREKRIQVFDSLGGDGIMYLEAIFKYLQDEHVDKKKTPLPQLDEWQLLTTAADTPRQKNGE
jgi:Ulp1 protease family, C-terminal catalytic domain